MPREHVMEVREWKHGIFTGLSRTRQGWTFFFFPLMGSVGLPTRIIIPIIFFVYYSYYYPEVWGLGSTFSNGLAAWAQGLSSIPSRGHEQCCGCKHCLRVSSPTKDAEVQLQSRNTLSGFISAWKPLSCPEHKPLSLDAIARAILQKHCWKIVPQFWNWRRPTKAQEVTSGLCSPLPPSVGASFHHVTLKSHKKAGSNAWPDGAILEERIFKSRIRVLSFNFYTPYVTAGIVKIGRLCGYNSLSFSWSCTLSHGCRCVRDYLRALKNTQGPYSECWANPTVHPA